MEEVIKLNAVDQYNKMFGLETLHPLVSVVDLSEATGYPRHFTLNYGVYALFLKNTKCGDIRYGKQFYDYQEGTVTSFAPGQVTEVNMLEGMQPSASGLLFHPDLIKGTSLGQGIKQYSFFSYSSTEALHLSEDEKKAESPSKMIMITTRMAILSPDGSKKINSYFSYFAIDSTIEKRPCQ